jgi:hypothetical protein
VGNIRCMHLRAGARPCARHSNAAAFTPTFLPAPHYNVSSTSRMPAANRRADKLGCGERRPTRSCCVASTGVAEVSARPDAEQRKLDLPPVNSHNEWSLLEEVIVGSVRGATVPGVSAGSEPVIIEKYHGFFEENAGRSFLQHLIDAGEERLYLSSKRA